ncbi:toll/interleukin-1 receptor domain-containing protein [Streptomyces phaeochromogenes]
MVRHGIEYFDDRDIAPGRPWKKNIFDRLGSADVIVLLLTPEFVASRFCMEEEVPRALRRHAAGACEIFPVRVASFHLADESPLREIQWFPSGKPVTERGSATSRAWVEVAKELQLAIRRVRGEERNGGPSSLLGGAPIAGGVKYGPPPVTRARSAEWKEDSRRPPPIGNGVKYGLPPATRSDSADNVLARLARLVSGVLGGATIVFVIVTLIGLSHQNSG